jgi:release factor glutamine methyltransferase
VNVAATYERGHVEFMGLDLLVSRGALVPRSETELLARTAIDALARMGTSAPHVIDMCTGSGNLACAIAHHVPSATVWCSDVTEACVAATRRNVEHLGLEDRVTVLQGDLFSSLAGRGLEGGIDLVVCNPPYISQKRLAGDRAELLSEEPREAFDGGPYGLTIHQRVVREALPFLREGGTLAFEIGLGQERQVEILFGRTRSYEDVRLIATDAGEVRVVTGRKKAS